MFGRKKSNLSNTASGKQTVCGGFLLARALPPALPLYLPLPPLHAKKPPPVCFCAIYCRIAPTLCSFPSLCLTRLISQPPAGSVHPSTLLCCVDARLVRLPFHPNQSRAYFFFFHSRSRMGFASCAHDPLTHLSVVRSYPLPPPTICASFTRDGPTQQPNNAIARPSRFFVFFLRLCVCVSLSSHSLSFSFHDSSNPKMVTLYSTTRTRPTTMRIPLAPKRVGMCLWLRL